MHLGGGGVLLLNSHHFEGKSHGSVSSPRGPSTGLPAEGLTATPRSQEPEAAPYLEGLASSLCGNFNESPDSGTSSSPDCEAPDDTSDSSSVVRGGREARARAGVCPWASPGVPRKPPDGAEPLTTGNGAEVLWSLSQHVGLPQTLHLGGTGGSAGPAQGAEGLALKRWRQVFQLTGSSCIINGLQLPKTLSSRRARMLGVVSRSGVGLDLGPALVTHC